MTKKQHKEFTNLELDQLKKMYLAGDHSQDIADAVKRSRSSVLSAIYRMIRTQQIPVVRSMAVIRLGGIDAAEAELQRAKLKGFKRISYLTPKCAYSNISVEALQQQISRYKLASHLL
ncbi:hypothetical protein F889_02574 [Acinetobacter colistiniresistens]|uniref:Helix-turn-helix domain-containing protein n=1 Tax=Acinetobacter colistiniresistens TaxID=280145 RepID=N9R5L4_9GAMM|nr:hypothetical protein [Acinetobacter colistiniresistens]ENX33910.1 hypothetical protein F889_02574 [Acinetobacter colistiniresistens]